MLTELHTLANPKLPTLMQQVERDQFYNSQTWRTKRRAIVARDNKECQVCKSQGKVTLSGLIAHHIRPIEFYPDEKLEDSNLLTVCLQCHNSIHHGGGGEEYDEWW